MLSSTAANFGLINGNGQIAAGLHGAVHVEPRGAVYLRSQVSREDLLAAAKKCPDADDGICRTVHGQPLIDFDARYPDSGTADPQDARRARSADLLRPDRHHRLRAARRLGRRLSRRSRQPAVLRGSLRHPGRAAGGPLHRAVPRDHRPLRGAPRQHRAVVRLRHRQPTPPTARPAAPSADQRRTAGKPPGRFADRRRRPRAHRLPDRMSRRLRRHRLDGRRLLRPDRARRLRHQLRRRRARPADPGQPAAGRAAAGLRQLQVRRVLLDLLAQRRSGAGGDRALRRSAGRRRLAAASRALPRRPVQRLPQLHPRPRQVPHPPRRRRRRPRPPSARPSMAAHAQRRPVALPRQPDHHPRLELHPGDGLRRQRQPQRDGRRLDLPLPLLSPLRRRHVVAVAHPRRLRRGHGDGARTACCRKPPGRARRTDRRVHARSARCGRCPTARSRAAHRSRRWCRCPAGRCRRCRRRSPCRPTASAR